MPLHRRGLVPDLSNAMPHYFDDTHREQIDTLRQRLTARTEWPTWLLLIGVYVAWSSMSWPAMGKWQIVSPQRFDPGGTIVPSSYSLVVPMV